MSLSDVKIRAAKPKDKVYKLSDSNGLYLYITPTGGMNYQSSAIPNKRKAIAALITQSWEMIGHTAIDVLF